MIAKVWKILNEPVDKYLVALGLIGITDMFLTAVGLATDTVGEYNPMLAGVYARHGLTGFVTVKTLFVVVPVLLFGVLPKLQSPEEQSRVGSRYTIIAIWAYLGLMAVGIAHQFLV
jgi:hypothetical protein